MKDILVPDLAQIKDIKGETPDVITLKLVFKDKDKRDTFSFYAGQFVELSVPKEGESTFCIASAPSDKGYMECSIKKVGRVTEAVHMLEPGDTVGIRGPYGNSFPIEQMKGRNILFIGGGIGLVPLRSLIREVLSIRNDFKDLRIIYGARSVTDLVYKDELDEWGKRGDIKVTLTLDPGGETEEWKGEVGYVPEVLKKQTPVKQNSIALTCGPPVMIKLALNALDEMGFTPKQIFTTLEMKMKCGIGTCGRCNVGPLYVCKDGPVFTYEQIKGFIEDIF
ncbi:MAG TPA: FAD/NAD(P)-binding protein [Spirochaetota bacterium]|nr:FAD/NAD(P)-binding protein [Spirochaetota bacterium]